ncbi:DUF3810 family protein [Ruminococcus sp. HUN007]|uniref:DUF3810 family protein n=1 Tax=Ruminococcus sp. HUN007 TaxID=1514668 RepID=UPI0005D1CE71|nr:DUF3810 family protein [Ruminococcus sp. HUN007]
MRKTTAYTKILTALILLTCVTAVAGSYAPVSDLYTDKIYPYLCDGISFITGAVPVPLGEMTMYIGTVSLIIAVILLILLVFKRKSPVYRHFCAVYFKALLMALVCIVFIYVPTWYVPFCGTVLGRGSNEIRTDFDHEDLKVIMWDTIEGINSAAWEIEIDQNGTVVYPDEKEGRVLIEEAMKGISGEFVRLDGYYPPVKTALCSDILERMCIGGYNYPFTMEPTRNKYSGPLERYVLEAHEYAHHKGYEKENEANFLSQLALINSSDPYMRLSGYYNMYWYLIDDFTDEFSKADEVMAKKICSGEIVLPGEIGDSEWMRAYEDIYQEVTGVPKLSCRACAIYGFSNSIEKEMYNADPHPIDEMPAVENAICEVSDTGWEVQAEILKENSYDDVVLLWLQYYSERRKEFSIHN